MVPLLLQGLYSTERLVTRQCSGEFLRGTAKLLMTTACKKVHESSARAAAGSEEDERRSSGATTA